MVERNQGHIQALGESDVEPVVEAEVVTQLPGPVDQAYMIDTAKRHSHEVQQRRVGSVLIQPTTRNPAAQRLTNLRID